MSGRASALAVLLMIAVAGCGGGTKTVTVQAAPATSPAPATGTTPSGATTTAGAGTPLATRSGSVNKQPVTLSIINLKRSGATVELTIGLTTTATEDVQIANTFDDGLDESITAPGASELSGLDTLDGVYLVDTVDSRKYPVARDAYNQCLCDTGLSDTFLSSAAPLFLSATFGAPPATVNSVDVFIPQFGTFVNVPIG